MVTGSPLFSYLVLVFESKKQNIAERLFISHWLSVFCSLVLAFLFLFVTIFVDGLDYFLTLWSVSLLS